MIKEKLTVVKIGGKIINEQPLLETFISNFIKIKGPKILVHGGGRAATQLMERLGIPVNMVDGRRITDRETLDVAIMVYAGLVNKRIVANLQAHGIDAIGLSGADGNVIQSHKRPVKNIDYGFVGDVDHVNDGFITTLIESNILPVFCPLTHDKNGLLLNTNADTIANKVAEAMTKSYRVDLRFCFEYNGVLGDLNDPESILKKITKESADKGIADGTFAGGMIPKLHNAFEALNNGVSELYICGIEHVHQESPGTQISIL